MKRANGSRRRTLKNLPGQLDLFGGQPASGVAERSDLFKTATKNIRKRNETTKRTSSATDARSRGAKSTPPNSDLVDTRVAALKLGLGVSTLEKMRAQRRGPPFIKLARNLVRYRVSDLDDWITSRVRHSDNHIR